MPAPLYYHPRMLAYDFGPGHPLRPDRVSRSMAMLEYYGMEPIDPGVGVRADVERVHASAYIDAVMAASKGRPVPEKYGLAQDTPAFPGMYEASLSYVAGSVRAAEAVRDGAPLAISLSGGLHHARYAEGSGFCVFNDAAVAARILRERFARVAYVDIDVHHGDGVQWIFFEDASVLTCSIHESGRTIYPGTGFLQETGADFTSWNLPIEAHTSGDIWCWAFDSGILPALRAFSPGAIVLQMGADAHFLDQLGHLRVRAQDWLHAVEGVLALGLPIVALGGGGYNLTTVPRMWTAAVLTLNGQEVPEEVPATFAEWGMPTFLDGPPISSGVGAESTERTVAVLQRRLFECRALWE